MPIDANLLKYVEAIGANRSSWHFAGAEMRRGFALRLICKAWEMFRRDAGPGSVGPAHESSDAQSLMMADDPRRDCMLLWLAERGAKAIALEAALLAKAVGATRRFGIEEIAILDAAVDNLLTAGSGNGALSGGLDEAVPVSEFVAALRSVATTVDALRLDTAFLEAPGLELQHRFPRGTFRHYVPAEPGAAWALNLALLAKESPSKNQLAAGLVSRALFRTDLCPEDLAERLVAGAAAAAANSKSLFEQTFRDVARGSARLSQLSRNARAQEAWLLVSSIGAMRRSQLGRALGLSRAGADLQARVLSDAGLVKLGPAGRIQPVMAGRSTERVNRPIDHGPIASAIATFDAEMAAVDQMLARSSKVLGLGT